MVTFMSAASLNTFVPTASRNNLLFQLCASQQSLSCSLQYLLQAGTHSHVVPVFAEMVLTQRQLCRMVQYSGSSSIGAPPGTWRKPPGVWLTAGTVQATPVSSHVVPSAPVNTKMNAHDFELAVSCCTQTDVADPALHARHHESNTDAQSLDVESDFVFGTDTGLMLSHNSSNEAQIQALTYQVQRLQTDYVAFQNSTATVVAELRGLFWNSIDSLTDLLHRRVLGSCDTDRFEDHVPVNCTALSQEHESRSQRGNVSDGKADLQPSTFSRSSASHGSALPHGSESPPQHGIVSDGIADLQSSALSQSFASRGSALPHNSESPPQHGTVSDGNADLQSSALSQSFASHGSALPHNSESPPQHGTVSDGDADLQFNVLLQSFASHGSALPHKSESPPQHGTVSDGASDLQSNALQSFALHGRALSRAWEPPSQYDTSPTSYVCSATCDLCLTTFQDTHVCNTGSLFCHDCRILRAKHIAPVTSLLRKLQFITHTNCYDSSSHCSSDCEMHSDEHSDYGLSGCIYCANPDSYSCPCCSTYWCYKCVPILDSLRCKQCNNSKCPSCLKDDEHGICTDCEIIAN